MKDGQNELWFGLRARWPMAAAKTAPRGVHACCAGQARGSPRSPGKSQAERGLVQLKDSRSAETGRNHTAPLSRDNDELALLLQLEHHWGRTRLGFQSKVPGEGIGPESRAG